MKIKFLPQNVSAEVESGKSVMDLAREKKLPVSSSCNGMCSCAECRVYIVKGEAHVLPPSAKEVELIGGGYFIDNRRLSCQLFCFGDVTVDLSEQVEREKQGGVMKKQFLKQISKDNKESSSLGGILLEQDTEINKVHISEEEDTHSSQPNGFYQSQNREGNNINHERNNRYWNTERINSDNMPQQKKRKSKNKNRKQRRFKK